MSAPCSLTVACSKCTPIKLTWDANNLGSETENSGKDEGFHEVDENDGKGESGIM